MPKMQMDADCCYETAESKIYLITKIRVKMLQTQQSHELQFKMT